MTAPSLLITGTESGVGKTMLGCALAFAFKVRGMHVGAMKPIALGCTENAGALVSADAAALLASASSNLPMEIVSPYRYASVSPPIDPALAPRFARIVEAYRTIAAQSELVIVEDTGGLTGSIGESHDFADLAIELRLDAAVVVANRSGFVEVAADLADYAARRGVSLRGFILNALNRESSANIEQDAKAVTRRSGIACLGAVRFKEPVSLAIVEQLL
jgi:dethiobiotin synthetase